MPNLYILSGCKGSGKTTASYSLLPELLNCTQFVNSDEFAKSLSPSDPSTASVSASRYMVTKIHYLLSREQDFSIETTLATRSLLNIIRQAKLQEYKITVLYMWLSSPELAIERIKDRVSKGGHNIPDETVRRRYYMGLEYLFKTYIPESDRWVLADNSRSPFTVVAEGNGDNVIIRDEAKFKTIRDLSTRTF